MSDFSDLSELIYQFLRSRFARGKVNYLNFFAFVSFLFALLLLLFAFNFGIDSELGNFYYFFICVFSCCFGDFCFLFFYVNV